MRSTSNPRRHLSGSKVVGNTASHRTVSSIRRYTWSSLPIDRSWWWLSMRMHLLTPTKRLSWTRTSIDGGSTLQQGKEGWGRIASRTQCTKSSSCNCLGFPTGWCCLRRADAKPSLRRISFEHTQRILDQTQGVGWSARRQAAQRSRVAKCGPICWWSVDICVASSHHWGAFCWVIGSCLRRLIAKRMSQRPSLRPRQHWTSRYWTIAEGLPSSRADSLGCNRTHCPW